MLELDFSTSQINFLHLQLYKKDEYEQQTNDFQKDTRKYKIMKKIILSITSCFCCVMAFSQVQTEEIKKVILGKQASVGVAILYENKTFTISNDNKYPLMSAFKFHIAITALKKMEKENISLDSMIYIEPEQIHKDTYSPLRDKYPSQRIHIAYRDIIEYTVAHSDNNTCDWLINFVGGIKNVDTYIKSLGIKDINLTETEYNMHKDIMRCYNNWSTPLSVAELLKKIYTENILTKEHFIFLEKTMLNCSSGKDKLKAGLPADIKFGHKTGHSDRTSDGLQISEADAGVIYLPNGEKCYIVVLIKDSKESDKDNAKIMAEIANITYKSLRK